METRREKMRIGLSVILVLALASFANATLSWTLVDENGGSIQPGDTVLITVSSGTASPWDWGVYLQSDYANTDLQNAVEIKTSQQVQGAGDQASVTLTDPAGYDGDNYQAATSNQGQANKMIYATAWSTVQFVSNTAATYTVELYDYTTNGGTYDVPGTIALTADITVVPEPATIALLGLGGLFLTRRRRRG